MPQNSRIEGSITIRDPAKSWPTDGGRPPSAELPDLSASHFTNSGIPMPIMGNPVGQVQLVEGRDREVTEVTPNG